MVNKNFIVCLAGLPASGKTTFAKILRDIIKKKFNTEKVFTIDPDVIRQSIIPIKFDYKFEPEVRIKNLTEIRVKLHEGNIVISDDLNYYTSMRHDLKKLSEDFNICLFIIHISTPLKICLKWNKARGKPIPNKIIRRINRKFDNFYKYNWDNPEVNYDMSQIQDLNKKVENLVEKFMESVNHPKKVIESEGKAKIELNIENENLDKITREYVGKLFLDSKLSTMKKSILKARKFFIKLNKNKNLKANEIPIAFRDYLEERLDISIPRDIF
ncbi:MAG: adenylyl-sulfate kinase [Candidatus Lokiarchaeota archaeon]|nr:adenylyl-sulfate kinase [Candidatus Lokiarchaeota archaeon]